MATIIRAGVLGSALAATLTQGYTFTENGDVSTNSATEEASTGLTTNEENRIFGGSEADASQFPYIVSLREDGADESTYCGGTLIASQYVVTAAHCVKTDEATIYASIGSAFGSGSGGGEQLKVIEGYKHPMYNKSEHLYDIGVLKLENEVSVMNAGVYTRVSYVLDYINDVTSGGTGSSFAENAAGSTDQGQDNSTESTSTDGTETPATTTPSTDAPATKVPTAVPMTEAPTVAPTTETPTPAPTTVSPTEMPETESPSTNQADQYDPDTESPETESASEANQYEPATDSAEQSEPSVNSAEHSESPVDSAEQNYPAEIEAPTPASGKECATQF
uniref:Peptidase S1 domain-containing protein n=2 Tax=Phytophthora ramorum TaxID=164328 RepID=H3GQX9_PHYRM